MALHERYHRHFLSGVEFRGWTHEHVAQEFDDGGRIVLVRGHDPAAHLHKVQQVLQLVQKEMSYARQATVLPQESCFLYVRNKHVVGLILVVSIKEAFRLIPGDGGDDDVSDVKVSQKPTTAHLGVSLVWVQRALRRQKIATRLVEAARRHTIYGVHVPLDAVAFSQPTSLGHALARRVLQRRDFLVYRDLA